MRLNEITKEKFIDTLRDPRKEEIKDQMQEIMSKIEHEHWVLTDIEYDKDEKDYVATIHNSAYNNEEWDQWRLKDSMERVAKVLQRLLPDGSSWDARASQGEKIEIYFEA